MTNNTEEVCLLENWTRNVSMNEVNLEQQSLLQDPFDSIWLKIVAVLSYFIGLTNSAIMLAFINYENGHHGNFRTVINQLLSNLYATVRYKSPLKKTSNMCQNVIICPYRHSSIYAVNVGTQKNAEAKSV